MIVPDISISQRRSIKYISKNFPEFYEYLQANFPGDISFAEKLYWWEHKIIAHPACSSCGKQLKFKDGFDGYGKYCCSKCANSNINKKLQCKNTCISKYGVENPSNSDKIKVKISTQLKGRPLNKTRHTLIKKYGVENPSQLIDHQQKCIATNLKRYGVEWYAKTSEYKQSNTQRANVYIKNKYPNVIDIRFIDGKRVAICKCTDQCSRPCRLRQFYIPIRRLSRSQKCPKKTRSKFTSIEIFVHDILRELGVEFITNTRKIITPKELDVYLPDYKLAIEVNGTYFHSTKFRGKRFHQTKFNLCEAQNIRLLTIWSDDIMRDPGLVKEKIKYCLNLPSTFSPIDPTTNVGSLDVPLNDHDACRYKIVEYMESEFWVDMVTNIRSSTILKGKNICHIYGNDDVRYEHTNAEEVAKNQNRCYRNEPF